jgi:hypothetical protein
MILGFNDATLIWDFGFSASILHIILPLNEPVEWFKY